MGISSKVSFGVVLLACLGACGSEEKDPLASEPVVRCLLEADKACYEYQARTVQGVRYGVNIEEARAVCRAGVTGKANAGVFSAGACPTEDALARCYRDESFVEYDYYYEGFGDSEEDEDPLDRISAGCQNAKGVLQLPPFD